MASPSKTYDNMCFVTGAGLGVAHVGECDHPPVEAITAYPDTGTKHTDNTKAVATKEESKEESKPTPKTVKAVNADGAEAEAEPEVTPVPAFGNLPHDSSAKKCAV